MPHFHVIKDPVHGTMQFTSLEDQWVKPFIDSPHFQRLRHIKQLGMGDFIFPGAVHSRFNHSLGCCYVASQIAHNIGLADEERQLVMIAALLHDVGHGPFSHAFEGIFTYQLIHHEDWTPYFLADYGNKKFFAGYNQANPRYHLTEEKFAHIAAMIMHQSVEKQVLADIVSSQLDADRLDYLLRDSHFCGVKYGEFDLQWMLHCMAIVTANGKERLGITHKGIGVVEHYLMARRLMTRNIYHAQKKLALEYLLVKLLEILAADLENHPAYTIFRSTPLGIFLTRANDFNQALVKNKSDAEQLKQDFLKNNYATYKELGDYDVYVCIRQLAEMKENHPAIHLAKRLQYRIMPKIFRLEEESIQKIEEELTNFKQQHTKEIADWQLTLIRTPHQAYSHSAPILVINERQAIHPISQFSLMLNAISDKLEHTAFLCVDKEMMEDKNVKKFLQKLGCA